MAAKPERIIYPPYVSYKFFINFINGLRENGIPLRIDRSVMPKASGSAISGMLGALRYFSLTDENNKPTPLMKKLVEAGDKERPGILQTVVVGGYQFLFKDQELDLERATGQQIADLFREQDISGSTVAKSIGFFLAIAKEAGIRVSPHVKPPSGPRVSGKRNAMKRGDDAEIEETEEEVEDEEMVRFQIPIPGKRAAVVTVPRDLEPDDWAMLTTMLDAYIKRMQSA